MRRKLGPKSKAGLVWLTGEVEKLVERTVRPLLGADSPLTHLPLALAGSERAWFEAVSVTLRITDLAFLRLTKTLAMAFRTTSPSTLPSALVDAWTLVDALHRLARLVNHSVPAFVTSNEFKAEKRAFLALKAPVEELRHAVQHLDERVQKLAAGVPAWGALSWKQSLGPEMFRTCALFPGGSDAHETNVSISHDPALGEVGQVTDIRLEAHGRQVSLSMHYESLREVTQSLRSGSPAQVPGRASRRRHGDRFAVEH